MNSEKTYWNRIGATPAAVGWALILTVVLLTTDTAAAARLPALIERAYFSAALDNQPLAYAVFLFHRLAALVWIAAEWTAAVVLILAYRALKVRFRPKGEQG